MSPFFQDLQIWLRGVLVLSVWGVVNLVGFAMASDEDDAGEKTAMEQVSEDTGFYFGGGIEQTDFNFTLGDRATPFPEDLSFEREMAGPHVLVGWALGSGFRYEFGLTGASVSTNLSGSNVVLVSARATVHFPIAKRHSWLPSLLAGFGGGAFGVAGEQDVRDQFLLFSQGDLGLGYRVPLGKHVRLDADWIYSTRAISFEEIDEEDGEDADLVSVEGTIWSRVVRLGLIIDL